MSNKILSYIIFLIALVVTGAFIYTYISMDTIQSSDVIEEPVKKVNNKQILIAEPIKREIIKDIVKEIIKDKNSTESNKTVKKKDVNKSVLISETNLSKEQNITQNDTVDGELKEINKTTQNSSKKEVIRKTKIVMGVDPMPPKRRPADYNSSSKTFFNINMSKKFSASTPISSILENLGGEMGNPVFIRIFKSTYLLEIWMKMSKDSNYTHLKSYPICNYSGELGPKLKEGDGQAPEGFYEITKESLNPNSNYHLSMNIGYPNSYDKFHKRTGSYIMIHGECVSIGCFAMGNQQIEEIYDLVESALDNGQDSVKVHIFPFRMTEKEMRKHQDNRWYEFWENLKEGYDYFEDKRKIPVVGVDEKGNYTFY